MPTITKRNPVTTAKKARTNPMAPERTPAPNGFCWCRCGGKVHSNKSGKPSAYFLPGHDRTAVQKVINKKYGSTVEFLMAHGHKPPSKSTAQPATEPQA